MARDDPLAEPQLAGRVVVIRAADRLNDLAEAALDRSGRPRVAHQHAQIAVAVELGDHDKAALLGLRHRTHGIADQGPEHIADQVRLGQRVGQVAARHQLGRDPNRRPLVLGCGQRVAHQGVHVMAGEGAITAGFEPADRGLQLRGRAPTGLACDRGDGHDIAGPVAIPLDRQE